MASLSWTVRSLARSSLRGLDDFLGKLMLASIGDRRGLLTFMFHAVREGPGEWDYVDPAQLVGKELLSRFVEYFQSHGYDFVSPEAIAAGLHEEGRYAWMTFDDGYYNNVHALSIMREFNVPATFFISANHVVGGKAFWWDVVFRERARRGVSEAAIRSEQAELKGMRHDQVDAYLVSEFGPGAFVPTGDSDRPMTPDELRDFSREPLVTIGNHTRDHAILTNYSFDEAVGQVRAAQEMLTELTGHRPSALAYPNGNHSQDVVAALENLGVQVAVTVEPRRETLPLTPARRLTLGRFYVSEEHCRSGDLMRFRNPWSLRTLVGRMRAAAA